jgi:polyphenol oxidase
MSNIARRTGSRVLWCAPWPDLPAGIGWGFTGRLGGHSEGPWGSLNVGDHVGDAPDCVAANREVLAVDVGRPVQFMHQVHGWAVHEVESIAPVCPSPEGDAAITACDDMALAVMVADCLPILLADTAARTVGVAHAGWRGLLGHDRWGVIEAVVAAMRSPDLREKNLKKHPLALHNKADDAIKITAFLGPCIGPRHFEVGGEVRQAFVAAHPETARCFRPVEEATTPERWWADLPALARHRLGVAGVQSVFGNDGSDAWCTVSQPEHYFSHRMGQRRNGSAGRQAACIWLMRGV